MEEVKKFWNSKYVLILLGIMLFAFIVRIWVLSATLNQPIWWDEGDYLSEAKRIGLNLETRDIWYYRRVFFLPLFFAGIYKLGGGEFALRFSEFLFSVLSVFLTYLIGKEIFNKKIGLIAAIGMSVCRIHLFLTGRLLTEVPATAFFLAGLWLFWKGYVNEEKRIYIWIGGALIGLAIFTRFALFLSIIPLGFFVIVSIYKNKLKLWKDKNILIFFLVIFLILLPFFIKYLQHYPGGIIDFITHYTFTNTAEGSTPSDLMWLPGIWGYFKSIIGNLGWLFFIFFLIGCGVFLDLILGYDLILKDKRIMKLMFVFLWILTPLVIHGLISEYVQERYLMWAYPAIFIIFGAGLIKGWDFMKKYNKNLANVLLIGVLIFGAYAQISDAKEVIYNKKDSYLQVKEASLWIKENTQQGDNIISQSAPQNMYYSERSTYGFDTENITEFEARIKELKPKYIIVSVFEGHPKWSYEYFDRDKNRFEIAKAYSINNSPVLVIYKVI